MSPKPTPSNNKMMKKTKLIRRKVARRAPRKEERKVPKMKMKALKKWQRRMKAMKKRRDQGKRRTQECL